LLRVETLSIYIGRSYGTCQVHKTSAIGTTDMDAMEFIPLKIGESDNPQPLKGSLKLVLSPKL